jgi:uncharacterized protein DUF5994
MDGSAGSADLVSLARITAAPPQDDAWAELVPLPVASTRADRPLRLRLAPSPHGRGALDGGWWPYSRDLAAEATDLVDHFPAWFDRIYRVTYSTPDWDHVSRRRIRADKVFVTFGSFPRDDTHLVLLTSVAGTQPLQLLVVPATWDARAAHRAMRAAASPTNARSGTKILEDCRSRSTEPLPRAAPSGPDRRLEAGRRT